MICPACGHPCELVLEEGEIGICPACARSVVGVDAEHLRVAKQADVDGLSPRQLKALRTARRAAREAI